MRILLAMLLTLSWISPSWAKQYPVKLGNTLVFIIKEQYGRGKAFVHVHENETTALEAARTLIRHQGGSLLTLKHGGGRNITFSLHHKQYEFDPNRIFTNQGICKTLNEYGPYSKAAHRVVKKFATRIINLLPQGKSIAVHNNETFSLKNYLPGQNLAHEARKLHYNRQQHYRNFFIVTQKGDYDRLTAQQFNSVWQAKSAEDDGSLSIRLHKQKYVNVEAGYDQLSTQIMMLKHA